MPFEDMEGAIVLHGGISVRSSAAKPPSQAGPDLPQGTRRDTSGDFILDTGAGYLVLDTALASALGLTPSQTLSGAAGVALAEQPVDQLELGDYRVRNLRPVLLFDASVVRRAVDRPILGLLGAQVLGRGCVVIDFPNRRLSLGARPPKPGRTDRVVDFDLLGDRKVVVKALIAGGPAADFILDTGATKCVLFEDELERVASRHRDWPQLTGLSAPTVGGDAHMRLVRLPSLRVGRDGPTATGVEAGIVSGPLGAQLSRVTGRRIAGLIGYSYLKRFRVAIDYTHSRLLLAAGPHYRDPRPYEFVTVGLQLARTERGVEVTAVADGSPAAEAGIAPGDLVLQVDTLDAGRHDLLTLARAMEGPVQSTVTLRVARADVQKTLELRRRQLL